LISNKSSRFLHKLAWSSWNDIQPLLDEKWNVSDFSFTSKVVAFSSNIYSNWVETLLTNDFFYFSSKLIKFAINYEKIATRLEWKIFLIDFGSNIEKIATVGMEAIFYQIKQSISNKSSVQTCKIIFANKFQPIIGSNARCTYMLLIKLNCFSTYSTGNIYEPWDVESMFGSLTGWCNLFSQCLLWRAWSGTVSWAASFARINPHILWYRCATISAFYCSWAASFVRIPTFADTNVVFNVTFYGGGSYFPQHANNCTFKLDCDFFPSLNPYLCNIDFVFAAILLTLWFFLC